MVSEVFRIRVFVSSPGDLTAERDLVVSICEELTLDLGSLHGFVIEPIRWETHTHSSVGRRSQAVISSQLPQYDIYLGIMGFYFGTETGLYGSGTEEEFEDAVLGFEKNGSPS
ncbi:MAG: DUF4062 domain-containing protein, partial [Pseudomonadota bacterium]